MPGAHADLALADGGNTETLGDDELEGLEFFRYVDVSVVRPLLGSCPVRTLAPGEVLIEAGRPNETLYLVLAGHLSVRLKSTEAAPITEIEAGETAGELSVIDGQPTSAYVVAESQSRVLGIDEEILWMLVNTSHAISSNLLFTLAKRMRFGNQLIFERSVRLEQYQFHATVDALTGLFNRFWLFSMLPRQMHRSRRCGEPLSLLMLDVDHFKQYNDAHGHVAGDCALGAVATTLRNELRPADMAVRYGGEEFLVILPNCRLEAARQIASRLRAAVANTEIVHAHGPRLPSVTVSVGLAENRSECTTEAFISAADEGLYRAKRAGRNRVSE